jgi:RimJ/RimL family protein N-acetyltransferase
MSLLHLETARLILRPFVFADAPAAMELLRDPEVIRFMAAPEMSEDDVIQAIRGHTVRYYERLGMGALAGVLKDAGELVGRYSVQRVEIDGVEETEVTYMTSAQHRRRGFAREAVEALLGAAWSAGVARIIALIQPGNVASERLAEGLGFRFEKDAQRDGYAMRLYALEHRDLPGAG